MESTEYKSARIVIPPKNNTLAATLSRPGDLYSFSH